ncbi:MAG: response regulator [Desulfocapsa sp.]|nr:response regulator [Desulfocapsa sp.]
MLTIMVPQEILIIDDGNSIADLSRQSLEHIGYKVFCASNAKQAIDLAISNQFDLVIVDTELSGTTGIDTFGSIRELQPGIVGILVVDHADIDMVVTAMNNGLSGVLEEPLNSRELVKAVQEALALAALREENTRLKTILPLYKLGEKFNAANSLDEVYALLLDAIVQQIKVPCISLMMFAEDDDCLHVVASRGMDKNIAKSVAIKPGEKIAGWVYEQGKPVILNRQTQEQSPFAKYLKKGNITASISFPLSGREKILGVLNISQTEKNVIYSQSDIELLSVICGQAVMALENVIYMEEQEENARTKALFEQYVAPEVAEILLNSKDNLMEIGEVREITVLFADIRNFTIAVQHLSHEDIHHFLTEFFDLFSEVAFSWKGTLDKFMGDAALVAFGAPISLDKPSKAAVSTAVELSVGFEQLRRKWLDKSPVFEKLGLGIGVSKGDIFHGNVGSSRRLDYTLIGTDVNIAQRLADTTGSGQILITEPVYEDVKEYFSITDKGICNLRSVEHDVHVYAIQADFVVLS